MAESAQCDCLAQVLKLMDAAQQAGDVEICCQAILPQVLSLAEIDAGFVLVLDPRLPSEHFVSCGLSPEQDDGIQVQRWDWLDQLSSDGTPSRLPAELDHAPFVLLPLVAHERVLGMIGLASSDAARFGMEWPQIQKMVGNVIDCLAAKASLERKLLHLDTFLEVSSLLARPVGLSESLDIALFSSMNAVHAEAASVLLLDESKQLFRFFHVEGAAKTLLGETTFDATAGVAGRVLKTLEAEIVNDVIGDEQFYARIDADTGFQTRNLIAVPLMAGNEPIGVLEVLNRSGNESFTAEDRLILISVADQIAYAIRNAQIFDRVVDAYCRRRQGSKSCDGCPGSLDDWSICSRYRQQSA